MTDTPIALETSILVEAYAKNDHVGLQVHYTWRGVQRRGLPDFLIRVSTGNPLVLEAKGKDAAAVTGSSVSPNNVCMEAEASSLCWSAGAIR